MEIRELTVERRGARRFWEWFRTREGKRRPMHNIQATTACLCHERAHDTPTISERSSASSPTSAGVEVARAVVLDHGPLLHPEIGVRFTLASRSLHEHVGRPMRKVLPPLSRNKDADTDAHRLSSITELAPWLRDRNKTRESCSVDGL